MSLIAPSQGLAATALAPVVQLTNGANATQINTNGGWFNFVGSGSGPAFYEGSLAANMTGGWVDGMGWNAGTPSSSTGLYGMNIGAYTDGSGAVTGADMWFYDTPQGNTVLGLYGGDGKGSRIWTPSLQRTFGQNPNLLFNSSANLGLAGWTESDGGWNTDGLTDSDDRLEAIFYYTGTNASANLKNYKEIEVNVGDTVVISGGVLNWVAGGTSSAQLIAYESNGTEIGVVCQITANAGQTNWSWASGVVPANTAYCEVTLNAYAAASGTEIGFARLKVEKSKYPTLYSDEQTYDFGHHDVQLIGGPMYRITRLGNQNAAGNLGVPVVVAEAVGVAVTTTAATQILNYTTPNGALDLNSDGLYEVAGNFAVNNGTNGNNISFTVNYTEPNGTNTTTVLITNSYGNTIATNGSNSVNNGGYTCLTMLLSVKAGTAITVNYQDPTNTPNDIASAVIKRLQ